MVSYGFSINTIAAINDPFAIAAATTNDSSANPFPSEQRLFLNLALSANRNNHPHDSDDSKQQIFLNQHPNDSCG